MTPTSSTPGKEMLTDPMERLMQDGLNAGCFRYSTDFGGGTTHNLDFHLIDFDVAIEVKRMHTPRVSDQMARHPNVIVAQGPEAVALLARLFARARGKMRPPSSIAPSSTGE